MKDIRDDFSKLYDKYEHQFIQDFRKLIQIPSVKGNQTFEAPFGVGPHNALQYMLGLSNKMGFETGQISSRVGWLDHGPDTTDYFGVLGHLDVVDVVNDWNYPPFDLTIDNGYFYGRGVLDNKGPLISTVYALYLIKQQNIPLKRKIRIIFGTDEESGSEDIPYYLEKEKPPYAGFTPDCKFPIVYGERGLLDLTISYPINDRSIDVVDKIDGVFDRSFLPDYASISINGVEKKFYGKKAPSNAPDMAENALVKLVNQGASLNGKTGDIFNWIDQKIGSQTDGKNLGLDFSDEVSGKLQLSFYALKKNKNVIYLDFSMRYPVSITEKQIMNQLNSQLIPGMKLNINRSIPAIVKNKDLDYIKRFSSIYEADTGLNGAPVTTTGVTYARSMPNIVAFGPSFPGQKGIAHKGDEWLKITDWQMMMEIYYDCLINELC